MKIALLASAFVGAVLVSAIAAFAQARPERVELPTDFRSTMAHYATVERADGKVYEIYINRTGLEGWRADRRLADGASFAIESFDAQRDGNGALLRDASGSLVKGESDNEIHVSAKRLAWNGKAECTSPSLMNGRAMGEGLWRMAAFDPRNGERIAKATQTPGECHQCHNDRRGEDFILSRGLLDRFASSGQVATISFTCGERDICFGGPPKPLSAPLPDCGETFPQ
jgi:hypothetical protein